MASSASPIDIERAPLQVPKGVPSLRAGEGNSFLLRRLHSLTGIIPIGAFLIEHFISNSEATKGAQAYNDQVKFLTSLPFVSRAGVGIYLSSPALSRALRPLHLVSRRVERGRVSLDRQLALHLAALDRRHRLLLYRYHTYYMRFTGVHLMGGGYNSAFWKV